MSFRQPFFFTSYLTFKPQYHLRSLLTFFIYFFRDGSLSMLPRLDLNFRAQVSLLFQPPKWLRLHDQATAPGSPPYFLSVSKFCFFHHISTHISSRSPFKLRLLFHIWIIQWECLLRHRVDTWTISFQLTLMFTCSWYGQFPNTLTASHLNHFSPQLTSTSGACRALPSQCTWEVLGAF